MGQDANSGRNASLDNKKARAAGRQNDKSPEVEAIKEAAGASEGRGSVGGAFGREGHPGPHPTHSTTEGGGGGGGSQSLAKDAPINTPRASKPEASS